MSFHHQTGADNEEPNGLGGSLQRHLFEDDTLSKRCFNMFKRREPPRPLQQKEENQQGPGNSCKSKLDLATKPEDTKIRRTQEPRGAPGADSFWEPSR